MGLAIYILERKSNVYDRDEKKMVIVCSDCFPTARLIAADETNDASWMEPEETTCKIANAVESGVVCVVDGPN